MISEAQVFLYNIKDSIKVAFALSLAYITGHGLIAFVKLIWFDITDIDLLVSISLTPILYIAMFLTIIISFVVYRIYQQWQYGKMMIDQYHTTQSQPYTQTKEPSINRVYLVKRQDGIFKIGKSRRFNGRFSDLTDEYGPLELVALWRVDSMSTAENIALGMTKVYKHIEGGRLELRQFTAKQARWFVQSFTQSEVTKQLEVYKPELL